MNTIERQEGWFKKYCEKYPLNPEKVIFGKPPAPDVIFEIDGRSIGLEITEIYRKGKLRSHEAIEDRMCRAGEKLLENKGGIPPCNVVLFMEDKVPKRREKDVVREICEIVCNNYSRDESEDVDASILPPEVIDMSIYWGGIESESHSWEAWRACEGGNIFDDLIRGVIEKKEAKYKQSYSLKIDTCWLLIAARGNRASSVFEFGPEMERMEYSTLFEKVFFLNGFRYQLNELKLV